MTTDSTSKAVGTKPSSSRLENLAWGLSILAVLGCFLIGCSGGTSGLYDTYMNYPAIKNTARANPGKIFTDANIDFANRNFKEAVANYEQVNPNLLKANLYYGICLMETGNPDKARSIFRTIAANKSMESPLAQWYQAMSYVKEGESESAILALESISDKSPYYKKAAELRSALELNSK